MSFITHRYSSDSKYESYLLPLKHKAPSASSIIPPYIPLNRFITSFFNDLLFLIKPIPWCASITETLLCLSDFIDIFKQAILWYSESSFEQINNTLESSFKCSYKCSSGGMYLVFLYKSSSPKSIVIPDNK